MTLIHPIARHCIYILLMCIALWPAALTAQTTPSEGQTWWGYWHKNHEAEAVAPFNTGSNSCSLRVTAFGNRQLAGSRLHGVRFWISDKTTVTAARVWASSKLPSASVAPDIVQKEIDLDQLCDRDHDGQPTEVMLDEAVTLLAKSNPYANAYVGFTLEVSGGTACQMIASGSNGPANSNFFGSTDIATTYGALAIQLLLSNDSFSAYSVAAAELPSMRVVHGQTLQQEWPLTISGTAPVSDVDYEVRMSGDVVAQGHYILPEPLAELDATVALPIAFELTATPAEHDCTLTVTQVNGRANESANATGSSSLCVLSKAPVRRIVMEEATATWCNNCTRGIVGMHRLAEQFPDNFIGIAMHGSDDPMLVPAYRNSRIGKKMPSLPIAYLDRAVQLDPYIGTHALYDMHFYADEDVSRRLSQLTLADIDLTAQWTDASRTAIALTTSTTFRYSADKAPYGIAFVLLEDGMSGDGSGWTQINGYSSTQGKSEGLDPDMQEFVDAPYRIQGYHFKHVAVDVAGIDDGIEGSVAAPITADAVQRFTHTMDLSANSLIQNRDQLNVVALLLDTETKEIVNAAKASVIPFDADGIVDVAQTGIKPKLNYIYDLSGRRTEWNRKGMYIVNGQKVVIK